MQSIGALPANNELAKALRQCDQDPGTIGRS
jgi:hypothetical protein